MTSATAIGALRENGYCVLERRFAPELVEACRAAFWPILVSQLAAHRDHPNRGPHRHFLPMPFDPPCFDPRFFFDEEVLRVVRGAMDDRVVADQWGCDVPLRGSVHQDFHVDYRRPLFAEAPDLELPPYTLVASFGLVPITSENGPLEIAPGSHRLGGNAPDSDLQARPVLLDVGDVVIRHPWTLHRGTPNRTDTPRPLVSIRYVRRWYTDDSREAGVIPPAVWEGLTSDQRSAMRFRVGD